MTLRVGEVVIDCADHGAVVDFWQAALDYDRQEVNEQYVGLAPRDKEPGRPLYAQVEIAGITIVTKVRDESNVWPDGVHVELLK